MTTKLTVRTLTLPEGTSVPVALAGDPAGPPILLLHGTADMRVPVDQSVRLAAAFKDAGNENVRLELLPGVGHYFELGTAGYQFDKAMELTASWLEEVLA